MGDTKVKTPAIDLQSNYGKKQLVITPTAAKIYYRKKQLVITPTAA